MIILLWKDQDILSLSKNVLIFPLQDDH